MNIIGGFFAISAILSLTFLEIYGLYLSAHEGIGSFLIAFLIPPWAIIQGFIGLF